MILNNAFLIHRPGIKTAKASSSHIDKAKVAAQNDFIKKIIMPELKQLYGTRKGCEKWFFQLEKIQQAVNTYDLNKRISFVYI